MNRGYVRRKLISLLVLDELDYQTKAVIGAVLLIDGKRHQSTLEMLQEEAASMVVIATLWHDRQKSVLLHRIYLELLFEMCKIQKLREEDLKQVSPEFLEFMFSTIEQHNGYDQDVYNYTVMKVLLALNEQYMINELHEGSLENQVFRVLKSKANQYRAFGENLVFLFNRGIDNTLQLMMMKFLYLVFVTPETYQFIYLNDLKVLVDVCIRELYDLSGEQERLRQTYLRILHPLLQNTQLSDVHYKRNELVLLLESLSHESVTYSDNGNDDTTKRLATRCLGVTWLEYTSSPSPTKENPQQPEIVLTIPENEELMELTPVSSCTDTESYNSTESESSINNNDTTKKPKPRVPPARKRLPPPVPSPRKMYHMNVRNTSAVEVATLSKENYN